MQACLKNKTLEKDMLLIDFMNVRNQLNVCYVQRTQGAYSMYINNMLKHCVTVMVALFCVMRCTFLKVVQLTQPVNFLEPANWVPRNAISAVESLS